MLDRFNAVQDRFEFREVTVVVPLGVWDREEGRRYLNAPRFAERIKDKVYGARRAAISRASPTGGCAMTSG